MNHRQLTPAVKKGPMNKKPQYAYGVSPSVDSGIPYGSRVPVEYQSAHVTSVAVNKYNSGYSTQLPPGAGVGANSYVGGHSGLSGGPVGSQPYNKYARQQPVSNAVNANRSLKPGYAVNHLTNSNSAAPTITPRPVYPSRQDTAQTVPSNLPPHLQGYQQLQQHPHLQPPPPPPPQQQQLQYASKATSQLNPTSLPFEMRTGAGGFNSKALSTSSSVGFGGGLSNAGAGHHMDDPLQGSYFAGNNFDMTATGGTLKGSSSNAFQTEFLDSMLMGGDRSQSRGSSLLSQLRDSSSEYISGTPLSGGGGAHTQAEPYLGMGTTSSFSTDLGGLGTSSPSILNPFSSFAEDHEDVSVANQLHGSDSATSYFNNDGMRRFVSYFPNANGGGGGGGGNAPTQEDSLNRYSSNFTGSLF
jgi:hypothetical protein